MPSALQENECCIIMNDRVHIGRDVRGKKRRVIYLGSRLTQKSLITLADPAAITLGNAGNIQSDLVPIMVDVLESVRVYPPVACS
jgi:hypothetical protein